MTTPTRLLVIALSLAALAFVLFLREHYWDLRVWVYGPIPCEYIEGCCHD